MIRIPLTFFDGVMLEDYNDWPSNADGIYWQCGHYLHEGGQCKNNSTRWFFHTNSFQEQIASRCEEHVHYLTNKFNVREVSFEEAIMYYRQKRAKDLVKI